MRKISIRLRPFFVQITRANPVASAAAQGFSIAATRSPEQSVAEQQVVGEICIAVWGRLVAAHSTSVHLVSSIHTNPMCRKPMA